MTLTPDAERKLHVLTLLEGKRISLGKAAEALGVTPRQVRRLRVRLRREGPADIVQCLDGAWRVYVKDRLVASTPAPPDPGQLRARKRR